jgi:siderophore synthetase component
VAGHRFHPSPKARQGEAEEWLPYAPEVGARFALRWLAVRSELAMEGGDASLLDRIAPPVPPGFRPLPVHPWQYRLLTSRLATARESGSLKDLGVWGPDVVATSSVRTLYVPGEDFFCKVSLDVRITNCIRKNAWYELESAVALSRLLEPVFAELGDCLLLAEPGYRTVALPGLREGLGVIVREGVGGCAGVPVLAGALADPYGWSAVAIPRLLGSAPREQILGWWDSYVRLVAPPVLQAYFRYGVVLEPHLQNVLVALDPAGFPVQAVFRDLEGTKLLRPYWKDDLHASVFYDAEKGWKRVVYCLFVNHLAEIAATLADLHPDVESELWAIARSRIAACVPDHPARLRALLAGAPLPAKTNLRTRWSRAADRDAGYVLVRSPFQS